MPESPKMAAAQTPHFLQVATQSRAAAKLSRSECAKMEPPSIALCFSSDGDGMCLYFKTQALKVNQRWLQLHQDN
jgi:hypothetical protein